MAPKPIVTGTDGSEESLRAVDWAAREAALRGAPLRIVAAPALLPRMASRVGTVKYDTVTMSCSRSVTGRWPPRPSGPLRPHPAC
jgi:nucleotide-binding universal stress UspA family protein